MAGGGHPAGTKAERRFAGVAAGERGIALPMSMMTLLLLTTVSLVLVSLAQTEPTISSNHLRAAQARAMAESGIERALWALNQATSPGGFGGTGDPPNVTIAPAAAQPYDGSAFLALGPRGGFHLTMTGGDPNLRVARAVGWSPTSDPGDPRTKSKSQVMATLARIRNLAREAPCALCAGSALALTATVVDARGSEASDCGAKVGAASAAALGFDATVETFGAGAPAGPSANVEGRDWTQEQAFGFFLTGDDLDTLRGLAILRGTYVRPLSDARFDLTDVPPGVVFVDTPTGTNALTATNVANVVLGPRLAAGGRFRGWLVVNGNVVLEGGADLDGGLYAVNRLATEGPAMITGLVVARHALGDPNPALANLAIRFDCAAARGNGLVPTGWFVRPGTYCDGTGGC